jgi:hypothetical protein
VPEPAFTGGQYVAHEPVQFDVPFVSAANA